MDQIKTGKIIRSIRLKKKLTQLELAEMIGVSDKAVSKWERGCGAPDISLLPLLSEALQIDTEALLRGDTEENDMNNGNMKKMKFYICPDCGNIVFSADKTSVSCCGKKLSPIEPQPEDEKHSLNVEVSDGDYYITSLHEMKRDHYISFIALLTDDTAVVKKRYPEWNFEARLPHYAHGTLLWYCINDGLFYRDV